MDRWQNRVAVVTGASSGIGAAIVKDLVQAGLIVAGLARRKDHVEEIRKNLPKQLQSRLHAIRCDVSDQQSVNEAFDWVIKKHGGVDVLINNAGIHMWGQLLTADISILQETIQTNMMGVVYCTRRAFESMKERNFDGHIMIMNSIAGHRIMQPIPGNLPGLNIYPSTKFGVTAMTEVLRQELHALGTKIKVTSISPGLVDTEMVPEKFKTMSTLNSEDVSAAVLYAIFTPPTVQVHELIIKPVGEVF